MSMQFTAVAALRLMQAGKLSLDTPVSDVLADYPNGRSITIRHLLTQTSGIADINNQPEYPELLKAHQTPRSLVTKVQNLPPTRSPGTYDGEEHSAYNLLALIIERKAGVPFASAVRELVFNPLGMRDSGIDDDRPKARFKAATGYQPKGLYEIAPAQRIHWSAKTGNASAYTTASDELKFVKGIYRDGFLKAELRRLLFDPATPAAYGWFKSDSKRFGQRVLSMSGRSPGFTSAMIYLPREQVLVVALSNIYASAPADMVDEIAALTLNRPYERLSLKTTVDQDSLFGLPANFQFPKNFYQPNAVVRIGATAGGVALHWPNGDISALIPTSRDHYLDRAYWMPVEIVRDQTGHISQVKYGSFTGNAIGETRS
jgi:CubicO group peptidase (beta-lactamase class C family)